MALLQSSTLSNQNIASALLVGTYTPSINRTSILCQVLVAQVAGNGLYTVYATRQINGTGAAYEYQGRSTVLVESGITSIAFPSIVIPALANDVIRVYLVGLPGDTTTPDTICEFWDLGFLSPTTADRTLDVSAGGEAGIDWANVGNPTTAVGLSNTTINIDKTGYSLTSVYDAAKTAATQVSVNAIPTIAPDNAGIAAIKTKTDNLPDNPADESILLAAINSIDPSGVTVSLAVSETDAQAIVSGKLSLTSYNQLSQTITSTVSDNLGNATKLWLAIKDVKSEADEQSIIFVEKSAGLTVVAKEAYAHSTDGSLAVSGSSGAWNIAFTVKAAASALLHDLAGSKKLAEIKALVGSDLLLVWSGEAVIHQGVIRAFE